MELISYICGFDFHSVYLDPASSLLFSKVRDRALAGSFYKHIPLWRIIMFEVGNIVRPTKHIDFTDGSSHRVDQEYVVTPETLAYYQVMEKNYRMVNPQPVPYDPVSATRTLPIP